MITKICIIDDAIPANNEPTINPEKLLNYANLKLLLITHRWDEIQLKTLIGKLLDNESEWGVSACTHPSVFINHLAQDNLRPEIVIYDWANGSLDTKQDLLAILKTTFCVVVIYARRDQEPSIDAEVMRNSLFTEYIKRIKPIYKEDENSDEQLMQKAREMYRDNFSYQVGTELRHKAMEAVDTILVELGKNSSKEVVWLLGEDNKIDGTRQLAINDLVAIIVEKLRNNLISSPFVTELPSVPSNPGLNIDSKITKRLWAYRMYYRPSDNIVRKGDIIKKAGANNSDTLYLVISSDCHLDKFWQKNMGFLALVPLHRIGVDNSDLQEKLELFQNGSELKKTTCRSITNTRDLDGPTIIPILAFDGTEYSDYMLCPKEMFGQEIQLPSIPNIEQKKRNIPLSYDYDAVKSIYDGTKRIGMSEPFLTPLVQHILANITGYGAPDYPKELRDSIEANFRQMF